MISVTGILALYPMYWTCRNHLLVTFLEITLVHFICTPIMYGFWSHNPFDINDPTPVTGDWTRSLCN